MATFVDNLHEQEQAVELARFVNKIKTKGKEPSEAFVQECEKIAESQPLAVIKKLLDEAQLVIAEASEKEVESYFFVILSLAKKLGQENVHEISVRVLSILTTNSEDKPSLRIRLLNHLYNIITDSPTRYSIFLELLKITAASKNAQLVLPILKEKEIERRSDEWGINIKQKRQLYRNIRDLLKDINSLQSYNWGVKYLQAFEGATPEELVSANEDAALTITEAIKHPDILQFDSLLNLAAVKKLENHPKYGSSFTILRVFVNENFEGFKTFHDKHPDFIKNAGLNFEDCLRKIRLLTLATLASNQQEITYAQVAKSLQISENEVEFFVIGAISENLISAKMDQIKRTIYITRSLQRVFNKEQWQQLSSTLQYWRSNVKSILENIHQAKQQPSAEQHFTKAIQQLS